MPLDAICSVGIIAAQPKGVNFMIEPIQSGKQDRREGAGEQGATMIEYALMISLIALVCFAAVGLIGPVVARMFAAVLPF